MSTIRKLFPVIILNMFLMFAVTIVYEYINLSDRFESLTNTFNIAVESAVDYSINAEEFFSEKTAGTSDNVSSDSDAQLTMMVFTKSGYSYKINPYAYAMYFNSEMLPLDSYVMNTMPSALVNNKLKTSTVYSWLYGKVGFNWDLINASKNGLSPNTLNKYQNAASTATSNAITNYNGVSSSGTIDQLKYTASGAFTSSARTPVNDFKMFYENMGKHITVNGNAKVWSGTAFNLENKSYPILYNMGLDFGQDSLGYSMQNWQSVPKLGKENSIYYLTPNSLGVTYVPLKMVYPTLVNTLTSSVVCSKLAEGNVTPTANTAASIAIVKSAFGCTDSSHTGANANIINDGDIEYDLGSLNVSVQYFLYDFAGAITTKHDFMYQLAQTTAWTSGTYANYSAQNKNYMLSHLATASTTSRIVAKVTASIKVYVPYQCDFIKFGNRQGYTGATQHYSIRPFDNSTDKMVTGKDGFWYEYSTYRISY